MLDFFFSMGRVKFRCWWLGLEVMLKTGIVFGFFFADEMKMMMKIPSFLSSFLPSFIHSLIHSFISFCHSVLSWITSWWCDQTWGLYSKSKITTIFIQIFHPKFPPAHILYLTYSIVSHLAWQAADLCQGLLVLSWRHLTFLETTHASSEGSWTCLEESLNCHVLNTCHTEMSSFPHTEQGQLYSLGLLAMIGNWQTHHLTCTGQMLPNSEPSSFFFSSNLDISCYMMLSVCLLDWMWNKTHSFDASSMCNDVKDNYANDVSDSSLQKRSSITVSGKVHLMCGFINSRLSVHSPLPSITKS